MLKEKLKIISRLDDLDRRFNIFNNHSPASLLRWDLVKDKTPEEIRALWSAANWKRYPVNLYLHFPFCTSKCSYCHYSSDKLVREEQVKGYIRHVIDSAEYFRNIFNDVEFRNLYFGGGSPSMLDTHDIEHLFSRILEYFSIGHGERTFECNPKDLTRSKIEGIRNMGFNRISLGVQSMDPQVLKSENRAVIDIGYFQDLCAYIRKLGFELNIDLIMGLFYDSSDRFVRTFRKVLDLNPDSISIYQLRPTKYYVSSLKTSSSYLNNHFSRMYHDSIQRLDSIAKDHLRLGDDNNMDSFAYIRKGISLIRDYELHDLRSSSCLGLGPYSGSRILDNYYHQKPVNFDRSGRIYEYRYGISVAARYMIESLHRDIKIDRSLVLHGKRLKSSFMEELGFLGSRERLRWSEEEGSFDFNSERERFFYAMLFLETDILKAMECEICKTMT